MKNEPWPGLLAHSTWAKHSASASLLRKALPPCGVWDWEDHTAKALITQIGWNISFLGSYPVTNVQLLSQVVSVRNLTTQAFKSLCEIQAPFWCVIKRIKSLLFHRPLAKSVRIHGNLYGFWNTVNIIVQNSYLHSSFKF